MNMVKECPCKPTCELRDIKCHGRCKAYNEWAEKEKQLKNKLKKEKTIDFYTDYVNFRSNWRMKYL